MKANTLLPTAALRAGLLFALITLPAASLHAASGGDAFGNTWFDIADGAVAEPNDFDGMFTDTQPVDNSLPVQVMLPFPDGFPFYGDVFTSIWVSDNGWISFADPGGAFPIAPGMLPDPANPAGGIIAPFWGDLNETIVINGDVVRWGEVAASNAFKVQVFGTDQVNGGPIWMNLLLYSDGRFQFEYLSPGNVVTGITIGIESPDESDGIAIVADGAAQPGVAMSQGYVISFDPPEILPPQCAAIPDRGCTSFDGSLPGPGPGNVLNWGCGGGRSEALEAVQSFTLTEASSVDITLTGNAGMSAYLLSECSERACIAGPAANISMLLGPGTYYVGVDAIDVRDEGPYTLDVACTPIGTPPLVCGGMVSGNNAGGATAFDDYPCVGAMRDSSGPELIYAVDIAVATNLIVEIASGAALDLFILDGNAPGEITVDRCIAWGDTRAVAWNVQPGRYLVVVDGSIGVWGAFDLTASCEILQDCSGLAGTVDFSAARLVQVTGDNSFGTNVVETYACDEEIVRDAPEEIWELILDQPGQIAIYQTGGSPVDFLFLSECNEGACIGSTVNTCSGIMMDAGTYYMAVDGVAGSEGPYEITMIYEELFNRWSVCEAPVEPDTMLTDTTSPFWNFTDNAFCKNDCDSGASCDPMGPPCADGSACTPNIAALGVDCTFAMYVTVDCGTALHLPLYDCEGGHVRIFDVFNGVYLDLEGRSPTWAQSGTEIQWQDADCESGSNPRWNEVVTDVSFMDVNGLCGVYRLEFINHSGFVWELFANCDGARSPAFNISDSLCHALDGYGPLPNLSLVAGTLGEIYSCPDVDVTYDVRNDGCTPVFDVEVVLSDSGTGLFTDIVPVVLPGETVRRNFVAAVPVPSVSLILSVDPNDLIVECDEAVGASSCGVSATVDILPLLGCAEACAIDVRPTVTPAALCDDDVTPVVLDACGTVFQDCAELEFAYVEIGSGMMPVFGPDCSWVLDPPPAATASYSLIARCVADPTCDDFEVVEVTVNRRPDMDAASVQARDLTNCNLGIRISWDPATFYGPSGRGVYNVYRSLTDCLTNLEVVTLGIVDDGSMMNFEYNDTPEMPDTPYFYVVEAEDDLLTTPCLPPGPNNGGSTRRVPANGGACTGIIDILNPDISALPRVGESLRVGGWDMMTGALQYSETFVQLFWTPDRDADEIANEHFHVYRSNQPDSGFVTVTDDAPPEYFNEFLDVLSDHPNDGEAHVWFYLVFTSDGCEGENVAFDSYCTFC